jgi:hypothetical protein
MRTLRVGAAVLCTGIIAAACTSSSGTTTTGTVPRGTSTSASTTTTTTGPNFNKVVPTTTPTAPPASGLPACATVIVTPGKSQAVAGTIYGMVTLAAPDATPCTITGYPGLIRIDAAGSTVPITIVDGLTIGIRGLFERLPAPVTLSPTQKAEFAYQYSDVPTGTETTCALSTALVVLLPGSAAAAAPVALDMSPCSGAMVYVSPIIVSGSVGTAY